MPFGVIFSIILIAIFLVVAFMVIKHFLSLQKCSEISIFMKSFQENVDEVWKSSSRTKTMDVILPGVIEEVCFVDFNSTLTRDVSKYADAKSRYAFHSPNFFFYPPERACGVSYYSFKHINMTQTISDNGNPFCLKNDGTEKISISKGFYESLVKLGRG